jgi:hypothetical protein
MHSGDAAIGTYAFMPKTVRELVGKSKKLKNKYGEALNRKDQESMQSYFEENPHFEHDLANHYIDKLHNEYGAKTAGDVGYAWLHGPGKMRANLKSGIDHSQDERYVKTTDFYNQAKEMHENRVANNLAKQRKNLP